MKTPMLLVACVIALTACVEETAPVVKDEAYYKQHPAERDEKVQSCLTQPGDLDNDKECAAALAAEEVHPVSYWKAHPEERKEKLEMCSEHRAALKTNGNCINAKDAARRSSGRGTPVFVQPG